MDTARKVMLITGASRGIGAATAIEAAAHGWDIALSYHSKHDVAEAVAEQCRALGASAVVQQCEVADEESVQLLFERTDAELGTLECLVNNAGILFPMARLEDIDVARFRRVTEVNTIGAFLCAREAVRRMAIDRGGNGGSIVNVSSAASYLGSPNEFVDYAMTKGAMDTMTIGLAKEVADRGIRVNGVRPGLIDTDIHADAGVPNRVELLKQNVPMRRGGSPEEVASLIMYLASDAASYVTGTNVNVAGGR